VRLGEWTAGLPITAVVVIAELAGGWWGLLWATLGAVVGVLTSHLSLSRLMTRGGQDG
jgi:hypothetical protein